MFLVVITSNKVNIQYIQQKLKDVQQTTSLFSLTIPIPAVYPPSNPNVKNTTENVGGVEVVSPKIEHKSFPPKSAVNQNF